jgi:anti-anti-sigma factor
VFLSEVAVTILKDGKHCRVVITGELDISTSPSLHERLAEAHGDVVIDCSELSFADSSGIAEFIQLLQRVTSVSLEKPSPSFRRTLEVLGLNDVLPTID